MYTNAVMVNAPSSDNEQSKRNYALNGLWTTFVNTANEYEVKQYLLNSPKVMKNVLPSITVRTWPEQPGSICSSSL